LNCGKPRGLLANSTVAAQQGRENERAVAVRAVSPYAETVVLSAQVGDALGACTQIRQIYRSLEVEDKRNRLRE
jgi:hypothetical protein